MLRLLRNKYWVSDAMKFLIGIILCTIVPGCVALPDTAKGKARANREYWVVSHTIQF